MGEGLGEWWERWGVGLVELVEEAEEMDWKERVVCGEPGARSVDGSPRKDGCLWKSVDHCRFGDQRQKYPDTSKVTASLPIRHTPRAFPQICAGEPLIPPALHE